jgi:hypothetical protein
MTNIENNFLNIIHDKKLTLIEKEKLVYSICCNYHDLKEDDSELCFLSSLLSKTGGLLTEINNTVFLCDCVSLLIKKTSQILLWGMINFYEQYK